MPHAIGGLGDGFKLTGDIGQAFRVADKQHAIIGQEFSETGHYLLLGTLIEINQHITAENSIERALHWPGFQ